MNLVPPLVFSACFVSDGRALLGVFPQVVSADHLRDDE
jgi:hypothetical protein